jgi:hypothetical protein
MDIIHAVTFRRSGDGGFIGVIKIVYDRRAVHRRSRWVESVLIPEEAAPSFRDNAAPL